MYFQVLTSRYLQDGRTKEMWQPPRHVLKPKPWNGGPPIAKQDSRRRKRPSPWVLGRVLDQQKS